MTVATWWTYEVRRCGHQAVTLPVLAAVLGYVGVAAGSEDATLLGRTLLTSALPAATALVCAAVVAREPMPELHLSLPTPTRAPSPAGSPGSPPSPRSPPSRWWRC